MLDAPTPVPPYLLGVVIGLCSSCSVLFSASETPAGSDAAVEEPDAASQVPDAASQVPDAANEQPDASVEEPGIVCGNLANLGDDFGDAIIDPVMWSTWEFGGAVVEEVQRDGQGALALTLAACETCDATAGIASMMTAPLTDSAIVVDTSMSSPLGSSSEVKLNFERADDEADLLELVLNHQGLVVRTTDPPGETVERLFAAYDGVRDRWWRIDFFDQATFWTSPDGRTWTSFGSLDHSFIGDSPIRLEIFASSASVPAEQTFHILGVNVLADGSRCPASGS